MWPFHIGSYEQKYKNAFAPNTLFGADIIDQVHKWVHDSLQSYNTASIEDVETMELEEFEDIHRILDQGK